VIEGYARVSTDGQDLATQHELLKAAGAELVYSEKQSGTKTDRAAVARCLASLEPGDTVLVTKLEAGPLNVGFAQHPSDNRRS
jgi:DNA invertase Pin-like site-specific DNA recombinase